MILKNSMILLCSLFMLISLISSISADTHIVSIEIDPNTESYSFSKTMTLDPDNDNFRLNVDYYNVQGDFGLRFQNFENSTGDVKLTSITYGAELNLEIEGDVRNVTQNEGVDENEFLISNGSILDMTYSGDFGCSDCITIHIWSLELNETDYAFVSISYFANNVEIYESSFPITFSTYYVILAIPILIHFKKRH